MRIQNHLVSFLFLVSLATISHAQTSTSSEPTFTQLSECRAHYQQTVAPESTDLVAADTYCVSRMSVANYCAGRSVAPVNENINSCMARVNQQNATAAQAAISSQQQAAALAAQTQQQQQAAAAAAAARTATATGTGTTAGTTGGTSGNSGAAAGTLGQALIQAGAQGAFSGGGSSGGESGGQQQQTAAPLVMEPYSSSSATAGSPGGGGGQTGVVLSEAMRQGGSAITTDGLRPLQTTPAEGTQQLGSVPELPEGVQREGAALNQAADGSGQREPAAFEGETRQQNDILLRDLDTIVNHARSLTTQGDPVTGTAWQSTLSALEALRTQIKSEYVESVKNNCRRNAERAEFLCVEGSSPGARAARAMLNVSGPMLAVINSAQRACSSTAKVTDFVSKALTVAKGACVASKMLCDGSCTSAIAKLEDIAGRINLSNVITSSYNAGAAACNTAYAADTTGTRLVDCNSDNTRKQTAANNYHPRIVELVNREKQPATSGTSAGLARKCEEKLVDIAAFAGNILSLVASRNSARDCERQLATDGSTGATVNVAQYCEQGANSSTQYCKCQRNSQQEGCPGFTVGSTGGNGEDGQSGTNIRNAAGLSNFAGAGGGVQTPGNGDISGISGGSDDEGSLGLLGGSSSGSATGGLPSVALGGGGSSGSANTGEAKEAQKKEDDKDKKKWDFGSFASSVGSALGFKGKSSGNGSVSSPKEEAIQRKVASDKLAGEISSASGKSNWEKVRDQYLIKSNSLIVGQ